MDINRTSFTELQTVNYRFYWPASSKKAFKMGGYFSSPDKGQMKRLINEYKEKLYVLDDALVGLFSALGCMDAIASSLEHELQADFDCTDQDQKESHPEQYRKLAARLLTTSKYAIEHQKKVTKHRLLSLLDFINNAIIENEKSVTFRNLTFANYEDDVELLMSQNEKNPIYALSLKIEEQTDEMKSLRKIIESLKRRETTYVEEEKLQREKIKLLEQQANDQSNNLRKDIEEMTSLIDSLNSQLQQANTYKKELDSSKITLQAFQEEHRDKISNHEKEKSKLKQRIRCLKEEKEKEERMHLEKIQLLEQQTKVQLNDLRKKEDEITTLNSSLQSQLQQANTYKKDLDSLNNTLHAMQEEHRDKLSNYEEEISEMKQRIICLKEEKEKEERMHLEQIQLLEQQTKVQSNDLRKRKDEITKLNSSLQSQLQQANTYKRDLDHLDKTLHSMQEEHRDKLSNYEKEISEMKQRIENLNAEKIEVGRQLKEEIMQREKVQLLEQQAINLTNDLRKEKDDMKAKNEEIGRQLEDFRQKNESLNQNSERLEENLKNSERKSEDISEKYFDLQRINSNLEQEKKDKEKLINELTGKYMDSKDSFEIYKRKYDNLKQNAEEQEKQIYDLKREKLDTSKQHTVQVQNLQKKVESLHQEKQVQLQLNGKLNASMKEYEAELKRLKDNLEEEIGKKTELNLNYQTGLENKDKEIVEQKSKNKLLEKEIDGHKRKYESMSREKEEYIRNIHKENKTLNETISAEKESFQNLKQVLKGKERELRSQETENTKLSSQLKLIRDDLKTIQSEYASKKEELEFIKSRKRVPVQLYTQKRSELTDNVGEAIIRLLKKEFVSDRLELEFWKCSRISDIHPNYPLLVICVTVSRIGTDVANSIHGISLSPNMAVMVFHHKDEHALPNQLSERILTGKELKDIGGIYDMAYFSGKGIYPCEMNRNSADSLVTFIKRVARNIHP